MTITATSYLREPNGEFQELSSASCPADPQYIDGAICLSIEGTEVLGLQDWDLVDQLWSYIINLLETLAESNSASVYFPDSPVLLSFTMSPGGVSVDVSAKEFRRGAWAPRQEFLACLQEAGSYFFDRLAELLPETRDLQEREVQRLERAISRLGGPQHY